MLSGFIPTSFRTIKRTIPKGNPDCINKLLDKIISLDFNGNLLLEYTYLFSCAGIPSAIIKDIAKLKAKVGEQK